MRKTSQRPRRVALPVLVRHRPTTRQTQTEGTMDDFPRGSEWRKWDLHVPPPGTKLNNGYPSDWDRFCETLESSEVEAFGITDYFSLDGFIQCRDEFQRRYPD